jgi:hypothetical protein
MWCSPSLRPHVSQPISATPRWCLLPVLFMESLVQLVQLLLRTLTCASSLALTSAQIGGNRGELFQRRLQVFHDALGQHVGFG